VCATGYGSMNEWAAKLISPEGRRTVGKCWGLGSGTRYDPGPWVGELRNMWEADAAARIVVPWGNLMQSRHYSLYLALQLKARMEDIPTPVYYVDPRASQALRWRLLRADRRVRERGLRGVHRSGAGLRIGEPSRRLDALLEAEGATAAAYITAANRAASQRTDAENESAGVTLDELLAKIWVPRYAGRDRDPGNRRAAEPSVLVIGIYRDNAVTLARIFGKTRIVLIEKGQGAGAGDLLTRLRLVLDTHVWLDWLGVRRSRHRAHPQRRSA